MRVYMRCVHMEVRYTHLCTYRRQGMGSLL